jgi:hypothetical protein
VRIVGPTEMEPNALAVDVTYVRPTVPRKTPSPLARLKYAWSIYRYLGDRKLMHPDLPGGWVLRLRILNAGGEILFDATEPDIRLLCQYASEPPGRPADEAV